jgi:signal transduction histidine kinase
MKSATERRPSATKPPAPPDEAPPVSPRLGEAAVRVADAWTVKAGEAANREEVVELLNLIVRTVTQGQLATGLDPRLSSVVGRRLVELFRAEVIEDWRSTDRTVPPAEILETLHRIEVLQQAIEPSWDQYFSNRLAGPGGLELVVEVAHDLRSPLTSILFLAEMLQRGRSGDVNELQHRQLGLVYSAALGLSTMASNVIEMARGGNRLAEEEPSPFSVREILESVHDIVRPIAEEKGLSVQIAHPIVDHRLGHPQALSRVLLNLTTNALKFTEEGFVRIDAKKRGRSEVEFSVRDSGNGINPKALETLYMPFRRSASGDGYAFSGTGLGLALSRKLVEAMGSELRVETKPGWGTRFYFEMQLPPTRHQ